MRKVLASICVLGLLAFHAPAASANLIVYEGFEYGTGAFGSANGGSGDWSGAWSGTNPPSATGSPATHSVVANSMAYSDGTNSLPTSGNQLRIVTSGTSAAFRSLGSSFTLSAATPELWISFLAVSEGTGHLGVSLFNGTAEQTLVGKRGSTTNWGISVSNPPGPASQSVHSSIAADTVAFLLFKYTWTGVATPATIELWVNPDLDSPPASAADASTTINNFTFNTVRLSAASTGNIDEVRIGTSFVSVVPEPAALGLLGLGGLAMLRRRRVAV